MAAYWHTAAWTCTVIFVHFCAINGWLHDCILAHSSMDMYSDICHCCVINASLHGSMLDKAFISSTSSSNLCQINRKIHQCRLCSIAPVPPPPPAQNTARTQFSGQEMSVQLGCIYSARLLGSCGQYWDRTIMSSKALGKVQRFQQQWRSAPSLTLHLCLQGQKALGLSKDAGGHAATSRAHHAGC